MDTTSVAAGTVRAVNTLTAEWAGADGADAGTVGSAAGVWPVLALLAGGAGGPARRELEEALGVNAAAACADARALLAALGGTPGVASALGLWTRDRLPLEPAWRDSLPAGAHGLLTGGAETDRKALDAWASQHTEGAIDALPVPVAEDTELVLASALTVRTEWVKPFEAGWPALEPRSGPWRGRRLAALTRSTAMLDRMRVAQSPDGPLTVLHVLGDTGVDVHLLLGPEGAGPGAVVRAGVEVLCGAYDFVPGDQLPYGEPGPGVRVHSVPSWDGDPRLAVTTVPFTVSAEHDLLRRPHLFGLATAADGSRGHFPGISAEPLAVGAARQSVTASFSARGFRAAAVSAAAAISSGVPHRTAKVVSVTFDRPFAFLAVHRASRLVLASGWVTDPDAAPGPE